MVKVVFIGDIVGRPGREFVKERVGRLIEEEGIAIVIANGENAAGGSGITALIANDLLSKGVDGITLGDHVWDQRGFEIDIEKLEWVCRPANLPETCPGRKYLIIEKAGFRLGVFTVLGRNFMKIKASCPFQATEQILKELKGRVDAVLAEIHAETTSEKVAFGRYLAGRVALVAGTHTHIPTADVEIFDKGTAYITDVGMTGPYDSVIGTDTNTVLKVLLDGLPRRFTLAKGDVRLCGCIVSIDKKTGLAKKFKSICIRKDKEG